METRYQRAQKSAKKKYDEWLATESLDEKKELEKCRERLRKDEDRLSSGINFLREHEERKRVHLTDYDADFQKDGGKGFVVGYQSQVTVDAKSSMIICKSHNLILRSSDK